MSLSSLIIATAVAISFFYIFSFQFFYTTSQKNILNDNTYKDYLNAISSKEVFTSEDEGLDMKQSNDESNGSTEESKKSNDDYVDYDTIINNINNNNETPYRTLSTLQCDRFPGGPTDPNSIKDIVYWYDIPSDANFMNPFQKIIANEKQDEKYFLFEHDGAGWNNCRMSFENVIVLAIATGRTIVLPPRQPINLFRKQGNHTNRFAMDDIFDFDHIRTEFGNAGIKVITMEEFLKRVALSGQLRSRKDQQVVFPPGNRTDWEHRNEHLMKWLRKVVYSDTEEWDPFSSFVFWPVEGRWMEGKREEMERLVLGKRTKYYDDYVGKPVPVNAPLQDRISEFRAGAGKTHNEMSVYDGKIEKEQVILFQTGSYESSRLLSPFYTFHFFEDWYHDLWNKRFVRDHLRYNDEIMCAAARIVESIKQKIREKRGLEANEKVQFHTMHIRRGDFKSQYEHTQITAKEYLSIANSKIEPNSTIYIATDEGNRAFFKPFKKEHDIYFLEDFSDLVKDMNPNLLGMVEQVVAAQGKTFHGTQLSTFTAYINRLRGYYSTRDQSDGYEMGIIKSYVFSPNEQFKFDKYKPIRTPFWMKEFPAAWRDIDFGIPDVTPK